jgi:hypothetical protein
MTDGRAHTRAAHRRDLVDLALDPFAERRVDVLDDIELDVIPAITGEAVDAIRVADRLERFDEQDQALLLNVDDPAVVLAGRSAEVPGARPPLVPGSSSQSRVRRRASSMSSAVDAHVQKNNRDATLHLIPTPVDLVGRRIAGASIHDVLDDCIEVELLAVLKARHLAEQLRV